MRSHGRRCGGTAVVRAGEDGRHGAEHIVGAAADAGDGGGRPHIHLPGSHLGLQQRAVESIVIGVGPAIGRRGRAHDRAGGKDRARDGHGVSDPLRDDHVAHQVTGGNGGRCAAGGKRQGDVLVRGARRKGARYAGCADGRDAAGAETAAGHHRLGVERIARPVR